MNPGSIAENAGLRAGDAVLQINSRPSDELEHEQAKQEIVASGNNVSLIVQRYTTQRLVQFDIKRLITCRYVGACISLSRPSSARFVWVYGLYVASPLENPKCLYRQVIITVLIIRAYLHDSAFVDLRMVL